MSCRGILAAMTDRYRCGACGNLTRFDIVSTRRARSFHHFSLGGELSIEETEVLSETIELVTCRWCGNSKSIEHLSEQQSIASPLSTVPAS
jgi:DNA-directed RNA polymerase subunit M/transcription elongation factor TFIIS